jgi:hypothetical protein
MNKVIAFSVAMVFAGAAHGDMMENYFACSLVEGKTVADVIAYKEAYQKDVAKRFKGYTVKVLVPLYVGDDMDGADLVWFGTFQSADLDAILTWYNASEWRNKFPTLLKCRSRSLWKPM